MVGSKTVPTPTTYDKLSTTILESLVLWRLGDGEGALTLSEDLECEVGLAVGFSRFSCVRTGLVTQKTFLTGITFGSLEF